MRGIHIFEKPYYREIRTMRGRPMRGPPVIILSTFERPQMKKSARMASRLVSKTINNSVWKIVIFVYDYFPKIG